ncbi:hypothetical protein GCM10007913_06440 [Devosia yakushimensis]|uniref:DoxX-like family protein n=1 Tax=Devosia yakushimensis TaxID=470028 RepID=A0ABQ5UBN2_9HYPH|nr:DoxX family protein [Devosia yakushimensis]GLQ08712.1 hypothetical protein GCM10007913_06440 [Devosia yakushimensis]
MLFYTYWASTALLTLLYLSSAAFYIAKPEAVKKAQSDLGYSATNLIPFLIVIKILAPLAIVSRFNVGLSDLAYAGVFYHLLISALAHLGTKKPIGALPAALGLFFLAASFLTQNAVRAIPSPYGL